MTRTFGYGGIANTNGARSFAGKTPFVAVPDSYTFPNGVRIDMYARAWNGSSWDETKIGSGPLNAMYARYVEAEAEIGNFSFAIPADHPRAGLLEATDAIPGARYARIYVGGEGYVFLGEITKTEISATPDGRRTLVANGWSSARELVRLKTGYGFTIVDETMNDAVDAILDGTGWTSGTVDAAAISSYSIEANGVSRIEVLRRLAEIQGFLLRFNSTTRTVDMGLLATNPAGVRFTAIEGPISPRFRANVSTVIPIAEAQLVTDSEKVINKVRIIGQMQGVDGDVLTMADATVDTPYVRQTEVGPDGRDVVFIQDDDSVDAYGPFEEDLQRNEIRALGSQSLTDRQRAGNSLYGAAVTFIQENKDPLKTYAIKPVGLRHLVDDVDIAPVCGKYPVWYRGWRDERNGRRVWVEVDADLYLLRRERQIEANGRNTWSLGWSTTTREMSSEGQEVAQRLNELKAAVAARLPSITWGGYPAIGRLVPQGMELVSDVATSFGGASTARKASWYRTSFDGDLLGDIYGSWEDNPGEEINAMLIRAMKHTDGGVVLAGVWDPDTDDWDGFIGTFGDVGTAGMPAFAYGTASDYKLTLEKVDASNYRLKVMKNGALREIGSAVKSQNLGMKLRPSPPGGGAVVRSGSAGSWGSWCPIAAANMTAPAAPTTTNFSSSSTHNVTMPATVAVGDMLICAITGIGSITFSTPSGWTLLDSAAQSSNIRLYVFYKVADGTEGGTTVNFSSSSATVASAHVYRQLAADYEGVPTISADETNNSGSPNATAVTPTQTGRFRVINFAGCNNGSAAPPTSGPGSGFTVTANGSGVSDVSLSSTYENANSNTHDPSGFGGSTVTSWAAYSVALMCSAATTEATTIVGFNIDASGTPERIQIQLATGAVGAESVIWEDVVTAESPQVPSAVMRDVATATRISARISTPDSAANHELWLRMLDQDDAA